MCSCAHFIHHWQLIYLSTVCITCARCTQRAREIARTPTHLSSFHMHALTQAPATARQMAPPPPDPSLPQPSPPLQRPVHKSIPVQQPPPTESTPPPSTQHQTPLQVSPAQQELLWQGQLALQQESSSSPARVILPPPVGPARLAAATAADGGGGGGGSDHDSRPPGAP